MSTLSSEPLVRSILTQFYTKYKIQHEDHNRIDLQLTRYWNFRLKFIGVQPRQIRISKELSNKIQGHPHQHHLFDIFYKTGRGIDINPYQTKTSFKADYHDRLFNDWGIHHIHLSSGKDQASDYFHSRTGSLLFARFTDSLAYFLDIKHHSDPFVWSDREFIRILAQNWPESVAHARWDGMLHPDLNEQEIALLRKRGYLFGVNVDGVGYMLLGYGQATSGDNIQAGRLSDKVCRWLWENEEFLETDPAGFRAALLKELALS